MNNARSRVDLKPSSTDLFLTIKVRRNYLISDTLNEVGEVCLFVYFNN